MSINAIRRVKSLQRDLKGNRAGLSEGDRLALDAELTQLRDALNGAIGADTSDYGRSVRRVQLRLKQTLDVHMATASSLGNISATAILQVTEANSGDALKICNKLVSSGVLGVADKAARLNVLCAGLAQTLFAVEEVLEELRAMKG